MADLNDTLGTLPSGQARRLSDDDLTRYLRETYRTQGESDRQKAAIRRLDFYNDNAESYLTSDLESLFKNKRVLDWRKALLPFAQYQNLTRRIVREISAVYSEPAKRTIKGANERYQEFQRQVRQDRRMREANRFLNLLNDVLLYPRMVEGKPRLDIVTPDCFWAIAHPNDPVQFVGAIIKRTPRGWQVKDTDPHYAGCDEETWFWLDKDWRLVNGSRRPHGLGRLPVILAHREPREDQLLDDTGGHDLISAHRGIALLNVLMLKAQKAGTQIPIATGDTSAMAREQPMDEEGLVEAPEGVAFSTLDLRADPDNYITAARAVIKQIAANYGIPESVFDLSYQATSGFEIELKRVGLREVRRDQILDYRPLERELAELQSQVGGHAWKADGWRIDFGEVETPVEPMAQLNYFEKAQKLGLTNLYEIYLALNPEATMGMAISEVEANLTLYLDKVRRFQQEMLSPTGSRDQQQENERKEPEQRPGNSQPDRRAVA